MNGNQNPPTQSGGIGSVGGPSGSDGADIDLGETPETTGMADMPQGSAAAPASGPIYPSVMLSGNNPALSKIPDKGRMLVHHSVISRRVHVPQHGKHKGKERHEVEIQLHKVRPVRGYKKAESKSKKSDDETAMEKLMGGE